MDSDLAQFLVQKFRKDLLEGEMSSSSDLMFLKFQDMRDDLNEIISSSSATPEIIQFLHQLNDFFSHWLICRKQKTAIKNIYSSAATYRTDWFRLNSLVNWSQKLLESTKKSQPHLNFDLDRFTFYESDPSHHTEAFTEHKGKIVDYLLSASGDDDQRFKAVGIYGMGGSGKTALVKLVLKDQKVLNKFEDSIIWACLSHLTSSDEVDIRIVKYMLNYLNYDLDELTDEQAENEDFLANQLKHQLHGLGNYVIVLDDLWHCDERFANFCHKVVDKDNSASGGNSSGGGVIIVTSRKKEVVEDLMFDKKKKVDNKGPIMIHVDPWDYMNNNKDYFLKDIVGRNENSINDDYKQEIVRLCHGLALAANELPQLQHKENIAGQPHGGESTVGEASDHGRVSDIFRGLRKFLARARAREDQIKQREEELKGFRASPLKFTRGEEEGGRSDLKRESGEN